MPPVGAAIVAGLQVIGGAATTAGAIWGGVQVAIAVGSIAYSQIQARRAEKRARAQAERLKREQARALREQQRQMREMSTLDDFEIEQISRDLTVMVKNPVTPRRFVYGRSRVGGIWLYVETTGPNNDFVHLILGLCEGPIEEIGDIYLDDEILTFNPATGLGTGKWLNQIYVSKHLGLPGQAADASLVSLSNSKWTTAHRCEGIAYLYVRIVRNPDLFPALPSISAVIKGKNDILDPRSGVRGYTANAALCLADYLTIPLRGPGIDITKIDQPSLIHAANVCDQPVELLAGGSEPRYQVNGHIDLSQNVEDNAAKFLQAMSGDLIMSGGKYRIQAGEFRTPTFTLTADMIVDGITTSNIPPKKDRPNTVKGTFVSEANKWQRFDFPSVTKAEYVDEDGMTQIRDINLDLVQSGSQAQRLANIELEQARHSRTLTARCNMRAFPVLAGETITVQLDRYFDDVTFRVVETRSMIGKAGELIHDLIMVESAPEIYEWSRLQEQQINEPPPVNATGPTVATPSFSPDGGLFDPGDFPFNVAITTLTSGASIRWSTTDLPMTPTEGTAYTGEILIGPDETLYARAFKTGYTASAPKIAAYQASV
jgi:hypothetical protein